MRRSNGTGTVQKCKGRRKPWKAAAPQVFDPEACRLKRPLIGYYPTRKEAEAALAEFLSAPYNIGSDITFAEIFTRWIEKKERTGKSRQTIAAYKAAFKRCSAVADMPVRKLKLSDLLGVFSLNSGAGKSTVNNIKVVIDGVFDFAERHEYISRNCARLIEPDDMLYTAPEKEKHRIFTLAEVNAVLDAPRDIFSDCTKILLYSGFRVEELLRLTRNDIHLDEMYFQGGVKTAAGKDRIVPIHHEIQALIKEYCTVQGDDRIFPINQNRLREVMVSRFGHLPHDTRHTFISRLQTLHADTLCIERIVGHSAGNVTDKVYTHKELPELRECMELLDYSL